MAAFYVYGMRDFWRCHPKAPPVASRKTLPTSPRKRLVKTAVVTSGVPWMTVHQADKQSTPTLIQLWRRTA